jgi:hypothetical protein
MSKIKHHVLEVRRDELLTVSRIVPAWELPVLQAIHGADAITEVGETSLERELPNAGDEYHRLENRYGKSKKDDNSDGPTYISLVYGENIMGVRALNAAIQGAAEDGDAQTVAAGAAGLSDLLGGRAN